MNILTLTERDGTATRIPIGVDAITTNVAHFFKYVIELDVTLDEAEDLVDVSELEKMRADNLMREWREHSNPLMVVR